MCLVVKDARISLPLFSQILSNGKGIISAFIRRRQVSILDTNAYLAIDIGPLKLKYIIYSFEVSNPSVPADFSFLVETYFRRERWEAGIALNLQNFKGGFGWLTFRNYGIRYLENAMFNLFQTNA